MNFCQSGEVVSISMRDEDAVDVLGTGFARPPEAGCQVTGEELIISAVHQNDFPIGRLDDRAVALLHVDKIDLENLVVLPRGNNIFRSQAG